MELIGSIEHLHQFVTVMICVAIKGKPVIGVIHNPFTLKTSWAWIGRGRSSDLVSYAKLGKKSTPLDITVSRSHAGRRKSLTYTMISSMHVFSHFLNIIYTTLHHSTYYCNNI